MRGASSDAGSVISITYVPGKRGRGGSCPIEEDGTS